MLVQCQFMALPVFQRLSKCRVLQQKEGDKGNNNNYLYCILIQALGDPWLYTH